MKVLIIAGRPDGILYDHYEAIIGVDYGAYWALQKKLPLKFAIGDFDSVSKREMRAIQNLTHEILRLPREKDTTDLEEALKEALKRYPDADITITGALGGRMDHTLVNLYLPTRSEFMAAAPRISFVDHQNVIKYLTPGLTNLPQLPGYPTIGFLRLGAEDFVLRDATYEIKTPEENFSDIYSSNSFVRDYDMQAKFSSGMVIAIYSNDGDRDDDD
ncbi:MAG: thiamine diphosphokinase [Streptococcaceae bacterium]|jgi:thiamine pyrophosphokinase|nr:thiamine diphosphokinase [Streptococcaceae bacterium]